MDFSSLLKSTMDSAPIITKILGFIAPFVLAKYAWMYWIKYVQTEHLASVKWTMLQIMIPKDIYKTPEAMEFILINTFYQTGGTGTWVKKYWEGKLRTQFSLEIASIDGKVYFFMRVPTNYKNFVEAQIYAQYPQIEIAEVDDYTRQIPQSPLDGGWKMWGCEFTLTKADAYPIKTYVDYGLNKPQPPSMTGAPTPSTQADPLTSVVEFMGSLKRGEQVWFQFIIRASDKKYKKAGTLFETHDWKKEGAILAEGIRKKFKGTKDEPAPPMSESEREAVSAIERGLTKYGFDVGIRGIYLAEKDAFSAINITALVGTFKLFGSNNLNGFKPTNTVDFDYPWEDPTGKRERNNKIELLAAYRERGFFYTPYNARYAGGFKGYVDRVPMVLTSEELATIYHFPGRGTETPTFKRVESKKAEPPSNLPI